MKQKTPYIKPTRNMHDSGFRTFEVGYILEMDDKNRVTKKEILGKYSDHVYQDYMTLIDKKPFCVNMDLTKDRCIRFFSHQGQLEWDLPYALSSVGLKLSDPKKEEEHE